MNEASILIILEELMGFAERCIARLKEPDQIAQKNEIDHSGMTTIQKAIELCGGPAQTARILGVSTQAVCFWRDAKRSVPADICPTLERATSGAVRCEDLRPDVDWSVLRNSDCPQQEAA